MQEEWNSTLKKNLWLVPHQTAWALLLSAEGMWDSVSSISGTCTAYTVANSRY